MKKIILPSLKPPLNENSKNIELSGFQQGVYIIQLLDGKAILKSLSLVKLN